MLDCCAFEGYATPSLSIGSVSRITRVAKPFWSLCGIDTPPLASSPLGGRIGTRCFPAYHCMVAFTLLLFFRHFGDPVSKCSGLPRIATLCQTLSPRSLCVASPLSRHPVCPSLSIGTPCRLTLTRRLMPFMPFKCIAST